METKYLVCAALIVTCLVVVVILFCLTSNLSNPSNKNISNVSGANGEAVNDIEINDSSGVTGLENNSRNLTLEHEFNEILLGYAKDDLVGIMYSEVCDALAEKPNVMVVVDLKQNGPNYSDSMSQAESEWVFNERIRINTEIRSEIINNLSSGEFILTGESLLGTSFYGKITISGLRKLMNDPRIYAVSLNTGGSTTLLDSVPLINAYDVWSVRVGDENITGEGQTICIIDSGINDSHKDLVGKVIAQQCYCIETIYAGGTGCCNNNQSSQSGSALDDYGHGTHVAGIAAANGTINGIAPNARLVSVKVTNSSGNWNKGDLQSGIEWCITNRNTYNISIISMSLGTYKVYNNSVDCNAYSTYISSDLEDAYNNLNLVSTIASGNNGNKTHIAFPACVSHAVSVGSTYDSNLGNQTWSFSDMNYSCNDPNSSTDKISCFTNRGGLLDLLAPGAKITSTAMNGGQEDRHGTSMSAPHVAGAAALLRQYEKLANNRNLTPAQIEQRFKDTGKLIYDNETGLTFPRIDAYSAIFPVKVSGLERVYASFIRNIFRFTVKNNYNHNKSVNWDFQFGDGGSESNSKIINLSPAEEMDVFFEDNWTDGDIYTVRAVASYGDVNDSEEMTVTIGDIIARDLRQLYASGRQRVFGFKILNNMNETKAVNWTLNTGETTLSASKLMALQSGEEADVFVQYNYTSSNTYEVRAQAMNGTVSDSTKTIYVTVT